MTKWTSRAIGKSSAPVAIDEALLDEQVVILLQGRNTFGQQIYSYLQLTLRALQSLKTKMNSGDDFTPSDFGTVVAAGQGTPTDETRVEMSQIFGIAEAPQTPAPLPKPSFQPKLWDDSDGSVEDGGAVQLNPDPTPSIR